MLASLDPAAPARARPDLSHAPPRRSAIQPAPTVPRRRLLLRGDPPRSARITRT